MSATVEIDVPDRWDAVALMQRLGPYHSYIVQVAPERWLVHAECPGRHGESLPQALAAIEESLARRRVEAAAVRIDGPARPAPAARGLPDHGAPDRLYTGDHHVRGEYLSEEGR